MVSRLLFLRETGLETCKCRLMSAHIGSDPMSGLPKPMSDPTFSPPGTHRTRHRLCKTRHRTRHRAHRTRHRLCKTRHRTRHRTHRTRHRLPSDPTSDPTSSTSDPTSAPTNPTSDPTSDPIGPDPTSHLTLGDSAPPMWNWNSQVNPRGSLGKA